MAMRNVHIYIVRIIVYKSTITYKHGDGCETLSYPKYLTVDRLYT
jgi:hypothetical protein